MKWFLLALLLIKIVSAQNQDFVNAVIVPEIVLLVLTFGFFSFIRFPKIFAFAAATIIAIAAYVAGIVTSFSSIILSLGSLVSTTIYIVLFLFGAMLISKNQVNIKKAKKLVDVRKMNRNQLSKEMSSLEKRIIELQNKIENIKIKEHNLELEFAVKKSPEISAELERLRKIKNELSDALDILMERREACKRAYREAV
ncbi:MAG: hypothetical protein QXO84_00660 [Candidatus Aenigmatarchaeota archaeon]